MTGYKGIAPTDRLQSQVLGGSLGLSRSRNVLE